MANIVLTDVNKIYDGKVHVVKDNNLEIFDKEFMVFVGPSGCGKSTTLRMIAGLEEITSGEIKIDNKVINDLPPNERGISMVFQNYALYPHMTVFDNMAYALKLQKKSKEEIKERVDAAAEILDLGDYLERKPKALSGGQRQRVALGRSIVRNPKVFLFDEPLSNLDAKLRVQMRAEIIKLHKRLNATMVYVTHDQTEAMTMGNRIAVLNEGIIQQCDAPLTLYDHPYNMFVAGFIGSPAMNFLKGNIKRIDNEIYFTKGSSIKIPIPVQFNDTIGDYVGKEIFLGTRPEHIFLNDKEPLFVAKIDVVESMGNESVFYLKSEYDDSILMRTHSRITPALDEYIGFSLQTEYMHLFDPETKVSLLA